MTQATSGAHEDERAEASAFAAIVRSSPDAVIAKTTDGTVTAWNDGAAAVYGYTSEEMLGRSIEVTIESDDLIPERARHARVTAGHPESGYRCTRLRADGSRVAVVMSMSPVRDERGRVTGVASISRPVSVAERDEARFASVLEAAPDAMVFVGRDGRIVAVNGRVGAMFGYEREELLGMTLEILLPGALRERHVAHRGAFMADPQSRMMGSGLALLALRRDGSTFPVEISLAFDQAGGEGIVIAAVRDVTEQRALQQSQANEVRLRELTDSVDIVFLLVNLRPPKYLYVSSNAERILGVAIPSRFKAADWTKFVHVDEQEAMGRDFYAPARAGRPATAEHRLVSPTGAVRWFRLVANPVSNPEGRRERTVITIEDITDRVMATKALRAAEILARRAEVAARLAEAEARTANDAKNQFLSRMSHELRTPLNAVLGFGQLLARHLAHTEHAEAVGHILKGGRHLLNLINDVLDIARIESGDMSLSREPVPVPELIGETLELMAPLAADAEVTLHRIAGPPAEYVQADRQRLRQILLNLIANAIKYNHPGGNVWVGWETVDDHASLTVRDDGQGISRELQGRLFTAFDRLGAEGTAVEGTGIGLALTRALVELMAGSITAESDPGKGSCFTVLLPRSAQPTAPQLGPSTGDTGSEPDPTARRSSLLLYIEDNEPNVDVVEHIIRLRPDWRLIHAGLGQLGIDLARAHHPDLVLLDLHLPDLPGRDVLTNLMNHPETAEAPVAILTADASSGQPRRLLDAGAYRFMTKPLDLDELLGLLDEVTERRDAKL